MLLPPQFVHTQPLPPSPPSTIVKQVIFCAAARTAFTGDLNRVDARGVSNIATSMQDELMRRAKAGGSKYSQHAKKEVADFGRVYHQLRWDVEFVGVMVRVCGIVAEATAVRDWV